MALTFVDTHNMIAFLTKSYASEWFNQIIDFLNASSIKYALTVNPNIYVSVIKQFWSSVLVKMVNDMPRLQTLVDKKKVVISEATARDAFRLYDVEGIDCLPNKEIFTELARMGYEKPSTKLTLYKAFFSSQWKFLIHTILQCMSVKRTSWNEFSYSMASAVICLSTGRKFNFSKKRVGDLSSHTTKYSSPALIHKVFANMRRVGKGCSGVETPLFEGMIVAQQVGKGAAEVNVKDVSIAFVVAEGDASAANDEFSTAVDEPSIPSPTPSAQPLPASQDIPSTSQVDEFSTAVDEPSIPSPTPSAPPLPASQDMPSTSQDAGISMDLFQNLLDTCTTLTRRVEHLEYDKIAQALEITKLKQRVKKLERRSKASKLKRLKKVGITQRIETSDNTVMDDVSKQGRIIVDMDEDKDVTLKDVAVVAKDLITEVVTAASATITAADPQLTTVAAPTLITAPSATRRRKGVVIRDPKETATPSTIIHTEAKSKDKGKGILDKEDNDVKRYQALKRKPQTEAQARKNLMIYLRNVAGFKMDYFKGMTYDDIRLIFEKKFNSNVAFLLKTKEQKEEEDNKAFKRLNVQDVEIEESTDVQGRQAESQAQIYQIDLEHADKVLSIEDVDIEAVELQELVEVVTTAKLITEVVTAASATITAADPQLTTDVDIEAVELQELVEVVTTAKLITEVVTAASATITAADPQLTTVAAPTLITAPSATRRRKGVVIRDPK
nr:hypothetical protein [Tanacetum cinerariifolium]